MRRLLRLLAVEGLGGSARVKGRPATDLHQAIRSENRRMKELSPEAYRVNLPTVFSANSLMQIQSVK